jgi:hypothetical protein
VVSSKKKSTVMSPIRRQMKKRNPSGGQNGQLVHWWVLIHSGPGSARRLQRGYRDSDYRLKLGHWPTHGLRACEISLVHFVVLSGDVLRLTGYVP